MHVARFVLVSLLFCLIGCEAPTSAAVTTNDEVEFRNEESGSDGPEFDDELGSELAPELRVEWLHDETILPLNSSAEIRLTSDVEYPLEVVVRERWDMGSHEANASSLGSFALEAGSTLDLEVGAGALANAGSEYSGMLKISVDVYDDQATHIATIHSLPRFFHRSNSTILFYTEQDLVAEYNGGLLVGEIPSAALEDDQGNRVAVTRVTQGGSGVVGERVELGNPNFVEDAP